MYHSASTMKNIAQILHEYRLQRDLAIVSLRAMTALSHRAERHLASECPADVYMAMQVSILQQETDAIARAICDLGVMGCGSSTQTEMMT